MKRMEEKFSSNDNKSYVGQLTSHIIISVVNTTFLCSLFPTPSIAKVLSSDGLLLLLQFLVSLDFGFPKSRKL